MRINFRSTDIDVPLVNDREYILKVDSYKKERVVALSLIGKFEDLTFTATIKLPWEILDAQIGGVGAAGEFHNAQLRLEHEYQIFLEEMMS